ncbi:MAG: ethanolamine ammonia-lyase subunit EutB [Gemmataceae bacterium]
MPYRTTLRGVSFTVADLRELLACAGEAMSGDALAGVAAGSERRRVAAKLALADVTLGEVADTPLIDDDVTDALQADLDRAAFAPMRSWTVGELREHLLGDDPVPAPRAFLPEVIAAAGKLLGNKDLVLAASRVRVVTRLRNTMGGPGVLGVRVQPNHPADDVPGILLAALEGLSFGCGDAVIGVNPAGDSVESVAAILHGLERLVRGLEVPTQHCVLAHVTTQLAALERGAPVDLLFQSVAGTRGAMDSFGVSLSLLREGMERVRDSHRGRPGPWLGDQVMYFETGQGSALSAGAHHGVDQLTLEARAYGVARLFDPFLVNSVVGFIGPEYLFDERQIVRAGLEDHFMGKMLGLPMGVDVCYTNHADADQNSADNLLLLLATAGVNYVMGVPCSDDVMLNYQSTSYHDGAGVRRLLGLSPAPEFAAWLEREWPERRLPGRLAGLLSPP